jgi:hypothetical protein
VIDEVARDHGNRPVQAEITNYLGFLQRWRVRRLAPWRDAANVGACR